MTTKYAIIDHVGSVDIVETQIYKKVYFKAEHEGYTSPTARKFTGGDGYTPVEQDKKENLFTVKKVCQLESPYARKITDKMKYRIRHTKHPEKVYFICPELNYYTEREVQKWHDRGIKVHIFEANTNSEYIYQDFYDTHQIDFDGKASINRRLAEIWAPAFGYQFSAPITRIQNVNNIENFTKRPDHEEMIELGETHYTKPFTSVETFLEMNRCIATDTEIKEFREYLNAYLTLTGCEIDTKVGATFGSISGNTSALAEFLNPDYIICEHCNRPMKLHTGDCECPQCATRFDEEYILDTYFEDSSDLDI